MGDSNLVPERESPLEVLEVLSANPKDETILKARRQKLGEERDGYRDAQTIWYFLKKTLPADTLNWLGHLMAPEIEQPTDDD